MARIPTGAPDTTLGNVVAPAQRAGNVDPRAFGVNIAAEAERVTGQALAAGQQQEAQALAEQQRALQQEEAERLTREREAKRVTAVTAQARIVNGLADIDDDIERGLNDGSYRKEEAGEIWQTRSKELMEAGLEEVDRQSRPLVEAALLDNVGRSRRTVGKMVEQRTRAEISQGAAQYLEEVSRYAARGDAQADEAIRSVEAFIPSVAGRAGIDAQKTVQAFRERVRFRQASDLVLANPREALKALRDKDRWPELDPDRRGVLAAQAEAAQLRAAERARIEAERIAREQDRVYAGAASVFESGRAFSAEYADQVLARLKGSPYESALREMISAGPMNVAAATLPMAQQRQQIDALIARANVAGSDPSLNREIERRQKVLTAAERDVREDPLGAANERGIVPALAPLNVADLQNLPAALAQRTQAAQVAGTWAGQPVSPLRPDEAQQLAQQITTLPVPQRAAAINVLARSVGDGQTLRAMAGQVAGKDQTLANAMLLAADGNRTTAGNTLTDYYLRGAEVLATRENKGERDRETRAAATIRGNIVREIGDAYFSPQARDLYVDAAVKVQAALRAEGASTSDADERAVRLATGGTVNRGGRTVVKPYGWTDRDFDDWLDKTGDTLKASGGEFVAAGARLTGEQLAKALPSSRLLVVGQGQYVIAGPGGQLVRKPDGAPLILDSQQ